MCCNMFGLLQVFVKIPFHSRWTPRVKHWTWTSSFRLCSRQEHRWIRCHGRTEQRYALRSTLRQTWMSCCQRRRTGKIYFVNDLLKPFITSSPWTWLTPSVAGTTTEVPLSILPGLYTSFLHSCGAIVHRQSPRTLQVCSCFKDCCRPIDGAEAGR